MVDLLEGLKRIPRACARVVLSESRPDQRQREDRIARVRLLEFVGCLQIMGQPPLDRGLHRTAEKIAHAFAEQPVGFKIGWCRGAARQAYQSRSEERRVGKECRSRWAP